jgi:ubiquinone/menaquinone biosynthesis C-methylase UbiE
LSKKNGTQSNTLASEKYNDVALHFDKWQIPKFFQNHLIGGPFSFADLGCGDGPWFSILSTKGYISSEKVVYAVDLEPDRIERARQRFPWITPLVAAADEIPQIISGSLDWVISTMVMEHVPDEVKYLKEIHRILKPQGKAYITTVYKRKWAWYFRKRNGESVLDTSHLREYTDLEFFRSLIEQSALNIVALDLNLMWFPLLDPLLFRLGKYVYMGTLLLKLLRFVKVPIPGYYELHLVVEK